MLMFQNMSLTRCIVLALTSATTMLATGCASVRTAEKASVMWDEAPASLGRVIVLHHVEEVGKEEKRQERIEEIEVVATEVLGAIPGTEVVESEPVRVSLGMKHDESWTTRSDLELIECARTAGAQTLCLLDVARHSGMLMIGLMPLPGWIVETDVHYRLRMLDVASGRLLAETRRSRESGQWFGFSLPESTASNFEADFRELLSTN